MMQIKYLVQICLIFLFFSSDANATVDFLTGFLQRNVLGIPLLHEPQDWPFDPEVGTRRAARYEQENGYRGEKLIERLGLGVDGNQERRLQEQRARDAGHLGGLNFLRP